MPKLKQALFFPNLEVQTTKYDQQENCGGVQRFTKHRSVLELDAALQNPLMILVVTHAQAPTLLL